MSVAPKLPRTLRERVANYPDVVYADTAFCGEMESEEIGLSHTGPMGCRPLSNHTQCHEYLGIDFQKVQLKGYKESLINPVSPTRAKYDAKVEEAFLTKEPAAYYFDNIGLIFTFWVKILKGLALVFAGVGALSVLILTPFSIFSGEESLLEKLIGLSLSFLIYFVLPISLYYLLKFLDDKDLLVRFNKVPSIRLVLRRDTGMVQFMKKGRLVDVPFSEVMGMTRHHRDTHGVARLTFHLNHKHSPLNQNLDAGLTAFGSAMTAQERWWYHLRWEFYRHYMDVTRPLPDIPELEPYRHLDPTTREWDKKQGRPKDYWLNMDQETYEAMVKAAVVKAKAYPFDDLDMVEKLEWVPAGDGRSWYQLG